MVEVLLLCLYYSFFHLLLIKEEFYLWKSKAQALDAQRKMVTETPRVSKSAQQLAVAPPQQLPPTGAPTILEDKVSCMTNIFSPPERGVDYTILQALFSIDMLILFVATTCGVGGTLTAIDNLGQIGNSLGYPTRSITTFVSLVTGKHMELPRTGSCFSLALGISSSPSPSQTLFTSLQL